MNCVHALIAGSEEWSENIMRLLQSSKCLGNDPLYFFFADKLGDLEVQESVCGKLLTRIDRSQVIIFEFVKANIELNLAMLRQTVSHFKGMKQKNVTFPFVAICSDIDSINNSKIFAVTNRLEKMNVNCSLVGCKENLEEDLKTWYASHTDALVSC